MNNAEGLEKRAGGPVHEAADDGGGGGGGGEKDHLLGGLGATSSVVGGKSAAAVPLNKRHERCNAIPFAWFCEAMEDMATKSGPENKIRCVLTDWFRAQLAGESPYPVIRLLLPGNDCRTRYGIKESTMADVYVKALGLAKDSEAAQDILEWKTNKIASAPEDLPEYIHQALKSRVGPENFAKVHTIKDVNDVLDRLEKARGHIGFRGAEKAEEKDIKGETASDIIKELVPTYPPLEQKWIVRVILGNNPTTGLKCGLSVTSVLSKLNPGSLQKFNECSDLRKAVEEWDSHALEVGVAFRPMLSKFFPDTSKLGMIGTAEHAMRSGPGMAVQPFVMDKKIDGERLLYHFTRRKQRFSSLNPTNLEANPFTTGRCFSKRGNEETDLFLALMMDLDRSIPAWVDKVILDGEVVCWDKVEYAMVGFGSVLTQAKREGGQSAKRHIDMPGNQTNRLADDVDSQRYCLKFVAFDVVYLSGEGFTERAREGAQAMEQRLGIVLSAAQAAALQPGQLTHLPLALRRYLLSKAMTEVESRIELCEHEEVVSGDKMVRCEALSRFFERVILRNEEGLVVKDLSSPYILGEASRTKQSPWVKLKPDYNDQVEDMDLVIIGGYVGEGKGLRGQGITSFLLACLYEGEGEGEGEGAGPGRGSGGRRLFVPLCKVGSGCSYEAITQIRNKVTPYQQAFRASKAKSRGRPVYPDNLVNAAGSTCNGFAPWSLKYDDIPDFLIPPEHSVVLTIKCGSLCEGDSFPGGISVRFPRLRDDSEGVRHDKACTDIMTLAAVKSMLARGFLTLHQATEGRKRKAESAAPKSKTTLSRVDAGLFGVVHLAASVSRESRIFSEHFFHVSDTFSFAKSCKQSMEEGLDCSKEGMQKLLQLHGCPVSQVLATPTNDGTVILIGQKGLNASMLNARKARRNDMMSYQWVLDCIRAQPVQVVERHPMYFISMSDATREEMRQRGYDALGDHTTEEGTAAQLRLLLDHMDLAQLDALVGPAYIPETKASKKKKTEADRGGEDGAVPVREETQETLAARSLERTALLSDATHSLALGWRQLAVMLNLEEREAVALPCNCLWHPGNLIYCDIYEGLGELNPSPSNKERRPMKKSSPWLRGIRARAAALGAAFSTHLHVGVTHVLLDPRSSSGQRAALRARREALRALPGHVYEKHWLGPEWLEGCLEAGEIRAPESGHRVNLS